MCEGVNVKRCKKNLKYFSEISLFISYPEKFWTRPSYFRKHETIYKIIFTTNDGRWNTNN